MTISKECELTTILLNSYFRYLTTQSAFTCSKSTMKTPKQCVKSVQVNNKDTGTMWCLCGVFIVNFEQI